VTFASDSGRPAADPFSAAVTAQVELTHDDFVMANHRVHGVSVLPGVALLDIVFRVVLAQGVPAEQITLTNVLFSEAIITRQGFSREISVLVSTVDAAGQHEVAVSSRWLRAGEPCTGWRDNATAILTIGPQPARPDLDLAEVRRRNSRTGSMAELYTRARGEHIVHGLAMQCFGDLYQGQDGSLLAQLDLDPSMRQLEDGFHLHPAKMDASTLAGFGQTLASGQDPFIPVYIERFTAPRSVAGECFMFAGHPETLSQSGEVLRSNYQIYDPAGQLSVEVTHMVCKRIRHPELITRLLAEVDKVEVSTAAAAQPLAPVATMANGAPATSAEQVIELVRGLVAGVLAMEPSAVQTRTGFYDLGLDSGVLLELSHQLESHVDSALYPTLLFEYSDIESLARHLSVNYRVRLASTPAPPAPSTSVAVVTPDQLVPMAQQWQALPALPVAGLNQPAVLLIGGSGALAAQLPSGSKHAYPDESIALGELPVGAVTAEVIRHGGSFVVLQLPAPTGHIAAADIAAADAAARLAISHAELVASVAAAATSARVRSLIVLPGSLDGPYAAIAAGLAALCATVTSEQPTLRCRVLELAAGDDVAAAVLDELRDEHTSGAVRLTDGVRQHRVLVEAEPPAVDSGLRLRPGGRYLITGGSGGVARALTAQLVSKLQAEVTLVARSEPSAELAAQLRQWAGQVRYVCADVSDQAQLWAALQDAGTSVADLDGVLHCAGITRDALLINRKPADLVEVCAPKVAGVTVLDALLTEAGSAAFLVLFSSTSAVIANPGQSAYAFANGYLDQYAAWRTHRAVAPARTVSVNWPYWLDGGMSMSPAALERARRGHGSAPLPAAAAVAGLNRALAGAEDQLVLAYGDAARITGALTVPAVAAEFAAAESAAMGTRFSQAQHAQDTAIAVIGLAGQYPKAHNVAKFWQNLAAGLNCVTEIPADRWDIEAYFDPAKGTPGRSYGRWGGFLDDVAKFDRAFFGISRRDAERMDPQERLFLTTCWQAIEDAGYCPDDLAGTAAGVYVGVMWNHYQLVSSAASGVAPTAMHAAIANRVSWTLDLRGPSMAVDTACSSSLSSLHLAVQALRNGECTVALAGGVNVSIHPQKYLQLAEGQFLSTDGRCRSLGDGGDGYVPAACCSNRCGWPRLTVTTSTACCGRRHSTTPDGPPDSPCPPPPRRAPSSRPRSPTPVGTRQAWTTSRRTAPAHRSATRSSPKPSAERWPRPPDVWSAR